MNCKFRVEGKQPGEELTILFNFNGQLDLGGITLKLTAPDTRLVSLPEPVVLTNPATGNPVHLLAVELRGNQAVWKLEMEDANDLYGTPSEEDKQLWRDKTALWLNWLDEQFRGMTLHFADGGSCSFQGHEFSDVDGNLVYPHVDYDRGIIDVAQVISIEICGQSFELS